MYDTRTRTHTPWVGMPAQFNWFASVDRVFVVDVRHQSCARTAATIQGDEMLATGGVDVLIADTSH